MRPALKLIPIAAVLLLAAIACSSSGNPEERRAFAFGVQRQIDGISVQINRFAELERQLSTGNIGEFLEGGFEAGSQELLDLATSIKSDSTAAKAQIESAEVSGACGDLRGTAVEWLDLVFSGAEIMEEQMQITVDLGVPSEDRAALSLAAERWSNASLLNSDLASQFQACGR